MDNLEDTSKEEQELTLIQKLAEKNKIDLTKPTLLFLPVDERKHDEAVFLDIKEATNTETVKAVLEAFKEAGINHVHPIYSFEDGSEISFGRIPPLNENHDGVFPERIAIIAKQVENNPKSTHAMYQAMPK